MAQKTKKRKKGSIVVDAKNKVRGSFNVQDTEVPLLKRRFRKGGPAHRHSKTTPYDAAIRSLTSLPADELQSFVSWVFGFPSVIGEMPGRSARTYRDLRIYRATASPEVSHQLSFITAFFQFFSPQLKKFSVLSADFEYNFLRSNYEHAEAILAQIEQGLGLSFWLIENKLLLLQRWKGLEAQKEFARSIRQEAPGSAAAAIANYVSQRNEDSTSFPFYKSRIERVLDNAKLSDSVYDLYRYILISDDISDLRKSNLATLLAITAGLTLCDCYSIYLDILDFLIATAPKPDLEIIKKQIIPNIPETELRKESLTFAIDRRLQRELPQPLFQNPKFVRFSEQTDVKLSLSRDNTIDAREIVLCASNAARLGVPLIPELPEGNAVVDLTHIAHSCSARLISISRILPSADKLLINMRHLSCARAIGGFLRFDISIPRGEHARFDASRFISNCGRTPETNTILPIDYFTPPDSSAIREGLELGEADAIELETRIRIAIVTNMFQNALELIEKGPDVELFKIRIEPLRIYALSKLDRIEEALSVAAEYCCSYDDHRAAVPLHEILADMRWNKLSQFKDQLSVAIVLEAINRDAFDPDTFRYMQFAYDEVLKQLGIQRPSEIGKVLPRTDRKKIIHFLHFICVPSVMDISFRVFRTSRETLEERGRVCALLAEINEQHADVHRQEVVEISKLLSVAEGLEDVDRSRVFANVEKLKDWSETRLLESFDRYKDMVRSGIGFQDPAEFEKILKDMATGEPHLAAPFLEYPKEEAGQLLVDLINAIRDEYLNNPDFGLDAYLSMRVRHGSLSGYLRGPFEEAGAVAPRDHATSTYQTKNLAIEGVQDTSDAERCIRNFSVKFDSIVDRLRKDLLRVKGPEYLNGFFDFHVLPLFVHYVRSRTQETTTFQEFFGTVLTVLDAQLNRSLQAIRLYFKKQFHSEVQAAFDSFRRQVEAEVHGAAAATLNNVLNSALPEFQANVGRVAAWFALDPEREKKSFRTMDQTVDIAVTATMAARRGFQPDITKRIEDCGLLGTDAFIDITDILFTVLDNVFCHSGIERKPKITIDARSDEIDGGRYKNLHLQIESEMKSTKNSIDNQRRLDRIRQLIDSGEYRKLVSLEGGTGLLKLKKIVGSDPRNELSFNLEPKKFVVKVSMITISPSSIVPPSSAAA